MAGRTTKVKVCGVTRLEDADGLIHLGIDAIGLNFHAPSPRSVTADQAAKIRAAIPPSVTVVGVFVNRSAGEINDIAEQVALDAVQLHGDESPDIVAGLKTQRIIKALRVSEPANVRSMIEPFLPWGERVQFLLDAHHPSAFGGTGAVWDWGSLRERDIPAPWFLAGGLNPKNVEQAVRTCRPTWVDVASGVEQAPGIKDRAQVEAFLAAVARADESDTR